MSLDSFLGKSKSKDPAAIGPKVAPKIKNNNTANVKDPNLTIKRQKFTLVCSNACCKFQRVVVKAELSVEDQVCPKCLKPMRLKKQVKKGELEV